MKSFPSKSFSILVSLLMMTGCGTLGPITNTEGGSSQLAEGKKSEGAKAASATSSASVQSSVNVMRQQSHPIDILVEEKLAKVVSSDGVKSGKADWWIDTGGDRRSIQFSSPFTRMQWDIVNLRLRDHKEVPIRIGTDLDARFTNITNQTQQQPDQADEMLELMSAISPFVDSLSFGGGEFGGGFSTGGSFGQMVNTCQRMNAAENQKRAIANQRANQSAHESYVANINDLFLEEGFSVMPLHKDDISVSPDDLDYVVEEVWRNGSMESFRIFTGQRQLLYKVPYHRSTLAISLYLKAKMITGELDMKSEKYTALSEAINLWEAGQGDEALTEFQRAIEIDPKFVNAYRYRSKFYRDQKRWKESLEDLSKAITYLRVRDRGGLQYERGQLYWEMDNIKAARKDFSQVLKWDSDAVWARASRGFCWIEEGNLGKAMRDFETILKVQPDYDVALCGKAWVLALQGFYEEAIALFDHVLELIPQYCNALRGRGYCYKMLGNKSRAMDDLIASVEILQKDPSPIAKKRRLQIKGWLDELQSEMPLSSAGISEPNNP